MADGPAVGTPLQVVTGPDTFPLAVVGTLDPRNAMAETLRAFLLCTQFLRDGGDAAPTPFVLEAVEVEWPDADKVLRYPAASIVDAGQIPYEAHALTPTALEATWDVFQPGTVLWKTAEAVASFQVDFWANDKPTVEALAARLPSLFNPDEGRSGVVLAGHPRYFQRAVRATLMSSQRMYTPEQVYSAERRLMAVVRTEVDVVQLRCATELQPRHVLRDGFPED